MVVGNPIIQENAEIKELLDYIRTYIHNCPLQPFSQDYGLPSHTTHIVCVNFMREWRDLHFNFDSEQQILRNFFISEFLPDIC